MAATVADRLCDVSDIGLLEAAEAKSVVIDDGRIGSIRAG